MLTSPHLLYLASFSQILAQGAKRGNLWLGYSYKRPLHNSNEPMRESRVWVNPGAYGNEVLQIKLFHLLSWGWIMEMMLTDKCYATRLSDPFRKERLQSERRTIIVRDCSSFIFHPINGWIYLDECFKRSREGFQVRNTALYFKADNFTTEVPEIPTILREIFLTIRPRTFVTVSCRSRN